MSTDNLAGLHLAAGDDTNLRIASDRAFCGRR